MLYLYPAILTSIFTMQLCRQLTLQINTLQCSAIIISLNRVFELSKQRSSFWSDDCIWLKAGGTLSDETSAVRHFRKTQMHYKSQVLHSKSSSWSAWALNRWVFPACPNCRNTAGDLQRWAGMSLGTHFAVRWEELQSLKQIKKRGTL